MKNNDAVTLIIVESPSKCNKINEYLGYEYKTIATFGHMRELCGLEDIYIDGEFKLNFSFKKIDNYLLKIQKMRTEILNAKEVIIATDDDREGESIGWHICDIFGLDVSSTKRIVFREITKRAILEAMKTPSVLNVNRINSSHARHVLDLLVGFKLTPVLWKHMRVPFASKISAGRCQSPALKIIYENSKEIKNSKQIHAYNTTGYFTNLCVPFELNCETHVDKNGITDFLYKSIDFEHIVRVEDPRETIKTSPEPFSTSRLQQVAGTELLFGVQETMKLSQILYEAGYITYMRTDSKKYSHDFLDETREFILKNIGEKYVLVDATKLTGSTDAHEAIRPTSIFLKEISSTKLTPRERKLYKLIWRNSLESCINSAIFSTLVTTISAPNDLIYKNVCEIPTYLGWCVVKYKEISQTKTYTYLRTLKNNVGISCRKIVSNVSVTGTKSHLSESSLVKKMEECGIGRPSTYSYLVTKLQDRGYVNKEDVVGISVLCSDYELEDGEIRVVDSYRNFGNEKGKLVLQPIGTQVICFLMEHFKEFTDYEYTRNMENNLDKIMNGDELWEHICGKCNDTLNELLGVLDERYRISELRNQDVVKVGKNENNLGVYNGHNVIIKNGKFGLYVKYNDIIQSLKFLGNRPVENIQLNEVEHLLNPAVSAVIRQITENVSIRKGKNGKGDYIYFKTQAMKRPSFFKMHGFNENYHTCDDARIRVWIKETYNIY
jgi:DNA topoisomerase-1